MLTFDWKGDLFCAIFLSKRQHACPPDLVRLMRKMLLVLRSAINSGNVKV